MTYSRREFIIAFINISVANELTTRSHHGEIAPDGKLIDAGHVHPINPLGGISVKDFWIAMEGNTWDLVGKLAE